MRGPRRSMTRGVSISVVQYPCCWHQSCGHLQSRQQDEAGLRLPATAQLQWQADQRRAHWEGVQRVRETRRSPCRRLLTRCQFVAMRSQGHWLRLQTVGAGAPLRSTAARVPHMCCALWPWHP